MIQTETHRHPFTMLELIIVMGIIAFIASVMVVGLPKIRDRARDQRCRAETASLAAAIECYRQDTGSYPPDYTSSDMDEDGVGGKPATWILYDEKDEFYFYSPKIEKDDGIYVWSWGGDEGTETADYSFEHVIDYGARGLPGAGDDRFRMWDAGADPDLNDDHKPIDVSITGTYDPGQPDWYWSKGCSCGWHDKEIKDLEKAHNDEGAKALYDFLCRPMKGRQDSSGNDWPGITPYYKPDPTTIAPCGHGEGWGEKKPFDSFKLVDPWGRPLVFRTKVREVRKWSAKDDDRESNTMHAGGDPQSPPSDPNPASGTYELNDTDGENRDDGWNPTMNPTSYDLYSRGKDGKYGDGIPNPTDANDPDNDNVTNWTDIRP